MTIHICGGDYTCLPDDESDCPDRDKHTPMPYGHGERDEWMAAMSRAGAKQQQCQTCGLYALWTPPLRRLPAHMREIDR